MKELKVVIRDIRKQISEDLMEKYKKEFVELKMREIKKEEETTPIKQEEEEVFFFTYEKAPKIPKAERIKQEVTKVNNDGIVLREIQCKVCEKFFETELSLKLHARFHFESKIECKKCKKSFWIHHLKQHCCIGALTCTQCDSNFTTKLALRYHMKVIHGKKLAGDVLACISCDKSFDTKCGLKLHMKKCSGERVISFSCDLCDKKFKNKAHIKQHVQSHAIYPIECKLCNQKVRPISMKDHMMRNHPKKGKEVKCKICSKSFPGKTFLTRHLKIHEKKFQCSVCDLKFPSVARLNTHMRNHENSEKLKCKICGVQLGSRESFKRHLLTHDKTREKLFKCTRCGYQADGRYHMRKHLKVHEKNDKINDQQLKTNPNAVKCEKCSKVLSCKISYQAHIKNIHGKREKFECDLCGISTVSKRNMMKHLAVKHLK